MEILKYIAVGIAGYLLGSVSISILMSKKAMGGDVREKGSGNAGATNMARVYGWSAGFLTLGGDMLKAAIAMLIGLLLLGDLGIAIGGIAAMIGHCFPVFYGFKGGKGVSILAAVACFMDWRVVVIGLAIFIIVALLTKKVSPGSLAARLACRGGLRSRDIVARRRFNAEARSRHFCGDYGYYPAQGQYKAAYKRDRVQF